MPFREEILFGGQLLAEAPAVTVSGEGQLRVSSEGQLGGGLVGEGHCELADISDENMNVTLAAVHAECDSPRSVPLVREAFTGSKARSVLGQLTPTNINKVSADIASLDITEPGHLEELAGIVLRKALEEPCSASSAKMHAQLCSAIMKMLPAYYEVPPHLYTSCAPPLGGAHAPRLPTVRVTVGRRGACVACAKGRELKRAPGWPPAGEQDDGDVQAVPAPQVPGGVRACGPVRRGERRACSPRRCAMKL